MTADTQSPPPAQAEQTVESLRRELTEVHGELQRTNSELLQLTLELEDRVAERTAALRRSEEELRRHRDHLQETVAERTAALEALNRRLKDKLNELQASEERFRSLVVTIPDIVYRIDGDGHFTFVNNAIRRLGYEPETLYGEHFSKIILPADVPAVSRREVLPRLAGRVAKDAETPKLFDERRTGERRTTGLEIRLVARDRGESPGLLQSLGPEAVAVEVNSAGMYSLDLGSREPVFLGTVGVIRDISERKSIEKSLRDSETRLKTIFRHTEAGILLIDVRTRQIKDANPSALAMIGAGMAQVAGTVCHRFVCPAEENQCPVLDLNQKVDRAERTLITIDGRAIPILKTVAPLELDGHPYLLESFVDISDLKKAEAALQRSHDELERRIEARTQALRTTNASLQREVKERTRVQEELQRLLEELKDSQAQLIEAEKMGALGTLTAGIAHELNNPMMGILNFTEYCLKHTDPQDRRYAVLHDTERETLRCIDIVKSLLIFSRRDGAPTEPDQAVDIETLFDRIFRLLQYRIERENVTVQRDRNPEPCQIRTRVGNLHQVLLNLVVNALDAVEAQPEKVIRVRTRLEGAALAVRIEDTGCGIAPELVSRIFDPFFTTKPPGRGTGLGLSVCHSLVAACRGRISCQSQPDAGTCFTLTLPLGRPDAGAA